MGGTLPVLVRGLARDSAELGTRLARLYWVNTAGAVVGTLAAGFLFLPTLGLRQTLGIAVALNLLAGVLALRLSRHEPAAMAESTPSAVPEKDAAAPRQTDVTRSAILTRFLYICFALVGATAMAYEIGWTRLLSTQLGSSTYAFTLMLATFLTGIVLGSAIFERWNRRHEITQLTFALTQTFTALTALAFLIFFPYLIEVLPPILRATHESFRGLIFAQFATSALAMLPAAIVFGFNFPAVVLLIAGPQSNCATDLGSRKNRPNIVGRAYAWNTLGALLGATATGFWLLHRLGSSH